MEEGKKEGPRCRQETKTKLKASFIKCKAVQGKLQRLQKRRETKPVNAGVNGPGTQMKKKAGIKQQGSM